MIEFNQNYFRKARYICEDEREINKIIPGLYEPFLRLRRFPGWARFFKTTSCVTLPDA